MKRFKILKKKNGYFQPLRRDWNTFWLWEPIRIKLCDLPVGALITFVSSREVYNGKDLLYFDKKENAESFLGIDINKKREMKLRRLLKIR